MSGYGDIETLRTILSSGLISCRIVVETRLQKFYLSRDLASLARADSTIAGYPAVDIVTRSEFYRSLPLRTQQEETRQTSLGEICLRYIREESFPILSQEIGADGTLIPSAVFRALGPITEFIEAYICYDDHTDVYRALVDEFGEVGGEQERLAELIRLADLVSANRSELNTQSESDRFYLLRSALTAEDKRKLERVLPEQLVFYLPTQFVPLERHLLAELCRLTAVEFVLDRSIVDGKLEKVLPSETFAGSTISFVEGLAKAGHCRLVDLGSPLSVAPKDLTAILDGPCFDECAGDFSRTSIVEVDESEPRIVSELVSGLLAQQKLSPSEVVVVVLDDTSVQPLRNELQRKQISVVHPGGRSLSESPFPNLFRAYLDWLTHPSIESFERFFLAPQIQRPFSLQPTINLIRASGFGLTIFNSEEGIGDATRQQLLRINELSGSRFEAKTISAGLDAIAAELEQTDLSVRTVKKTFHRLRYRLKELTTQGVESERIFMARALRAFSRIVRREVSVVQGMERGSGVSAVESLRLLERRVRKAVESTYLTEEIDSDSVVLTGLLDARSLIDKTVLIVGSVEGNFFRAGSTREESVSGWMDQQVRKSIGAELPGAEALSILRSLLVRSERLYFIFCNSKGTPPRFLERLSRFSNRNEEELCRVIGDLSKSDEKISKGAELLLARRSHQLTEYDGLISEEAISKSSFAHHYSVSDLQTLADCPHRYFFSKLLRLSDFEPSGGGLVAQIGGTLTHMILRNHFTDRRDPVAVLDEETLPWELPEFRQTRQIILRRYLPVAEAISDHLGTRLFRAEWDFRGERSLRLEGSGGPILISGVIDRVDVIEEQAELRTVSVWDYKTSSPKQQRLNSSLQVPVYALVLESSGELRVTRGGLLFLNYPGISEIDFLDPTKGPIREQLAAVGNRESWNARDTTELILSLDRKVSRGQLHQTLSTHPDVCARCEFSRICGRDELLLEQKERGGGNSGSLSPKPEPPRYRLFTERYAPIAERIPSERQLPAGDTSKSFVVHAGAGAGKTATMVHRVLSLLLAGHAISSIVTVTFTKKAAAELKHRIKDAIAGAIERGQGDVNLLCRAYYELERAQIGTIHSFCHRLLSVSPNVNRDFFRPEIMDGTVLEGLLDTAVDDIIERAPAAELNVLLRNQLRIWELRTGLKKLLRQPSELAALSDTYSSSGSKRSDIVKLLTELHKRESIETAERINRWLGDWIGGVSQWLLAVDKLSDEHREKFTALVQLANNLQAETSVEGISESYCQAFDALYDYSEVHSSAQKRKSKNNPVNYWTALRDFLKIHAKRITITDALQATEEELFNQSRSVVTLAQTAYQQVQIFKIANGLASFDDVIKATHQFLASGSPFIKMFSRSIKHILIDEFQDTDAVQWEIFRNLAPATIFIVGDYQQAIYGFRGGEISVFERAEREITAAGGEVIVLDDNYRSRPAIISFVNEFFDDLFQTDAGAAKVEARQMQPQRGSGDRQLEGVFRTNADGRNNLTQANRLAAVVDAIRETNPGEEIAIIARTSTQIRNICGALTRASLPYVVLHSGDFYDREEITLFHNLFTWLGSSDNEVALVGVLRSALLGLSDEELLLCFSEADGRWYRFIESDHRAAVVLRELRELSRRRSAVEIVELVMDRYGLEKTYRFVNDSGAISNLELLKAQLKLGGTAGLNIFNPMAVADWLSHRPTVSKDDLTSARQEEQIKIMTIHGAKGLEFTNVVLPFLEKRTPTQFDFVIGEIEGCKLLGMQFAEGEEQRKRRSLTQQALELQNKLKERAEERRVFYVACTRARDSLVLLNGEPDNDKDDPVLTCATSPSPAQWLKLLVSDGEEVQLSETVVLYRALPVRLIARA